MMTKQITVGSKVRYAVPCKAGFCWVEGVAAFLKEMHGTTFAIVREPGFCGKTLGLIAINNLEAR